MEINTMKGEWGGEAGDFGEMGGMWEAIINIPSSCFPPFSGLELTIQLFVEYIESHAILMTPSMRRFPDSLLVSHRFLFSTKHSYLSPLWSIPAVLEWGNGF